MIAAIYVRLSEEDKNKQNIADESESIQNQKAILLNYAKDKGWEVCKIYCDEDYSGADRSRPEFNALIADAKAKKFEVILCKSQSRFSRDMEQIEKYLHHDFLEWGIRFISVVDNSDNFDSRNKKSRQINGLVNEWYLEDISENIKAVFRNKHREGKTTRAFMPYGYTKEGKNKVVVDYEAAAVVKRIFDYYVGGMSTNKICDILNSEGILPPLLYKKSKGIKLCIPNRAKQSSWSPQTVIKILRNNMYLGDLVHNTYRKVSYKSKKIVAEPPSRWTVIPNAHEAIVKREIFDKAQNILNLRIKPHKNGDVHAFAKKIICAGCGRHMNKVTSRYKDKEYSYLRCLASGKCCDHPRINLNDLETIVMRRLEKCVAPINLNEIGLELERKGSMPFLQSEMAEVDKALDKQEEYFKNLYQDKINGTINLDEFIILKNDFTAERIRLKRRQEILKKESENKINIAEKLEKNISLSRRVIEEFVECIEVEAIRGGKQEVIIHWAF